MASRPPESQEPNDTDARNRWMIIQAVRAMGFGLAILGILMARGVVDLAGDANQLVGYGLLVIGLLDGFVMPQVLARKWRTPPA